MSARAISQPPLIWPHAGTPPDFIHESIEAARAFADDPQKQVDLASQLIWRRMQELGYQSVPREAKP